MDEPMSREPDLTERPFDPEMTETDEANAPDETGPTIGQTPAESQPDQEEIGI